MKSDYEPELEKLVVFRELRKGEINFVLNSWLKGLRKDVNYFRSIPPKIYFELYEESIRDVLKTSDCLVATPKDEPNLILGYLVSEERSDKYLVLHYVYVKSNFRNLGLANYMIETMARGRDLIGTHYSSKFSKILFNPFFFKMRHL